MYSIKSLFTGLTNPHAAYREIQRVYNRRIKGRQGIDVMSEDWDTLFILDACRFDLFQETNEISGELESKISKGSSTGEFLRNNFLNEKYNDTIYISANPHVLNYNIDKKFYDRARLWEDEWNEELRTVLPERVAERSIKVFRNNPNKRLIIHFIQPHYPFIGEIGREIEHGSMTGAGAIADERDYATIWEKLSDNKVEKQVVWDAYRENLELVLPQVENIIHEVGGKCIISSDHGNALGEQGVYGHPGGVYIQELVEVPWLTVETGSRREIISESKHRHEGNQQTEKMEERLSHLGYV
ncbi:alkaline phosphatase family protein [Salinigranum halophilum]|uniref:hypothetical protein n=1 Tax=Salinigranum halophilum TaxID=2565931 RepID=UPI0010A78B55|nr:hypothetical protein [Salinigranum halophilum]